MGHTRRSADEIHSICPPLMNNRSVPGRPADTITHADVIKQLGALYPAYKLLPRPSHGVLADPADHPLIWDSLAAEAKATAAAAAAAGDPPPGRSSNVSRCQTGCGPA